MSNYYSTKLAADRLRTCYQVAPPAAKAYLDAEIDFVLSKVSSSDAVLELGCGYGRVLERLHPAAEDLCGIDTSLASLVAAREFLGASLPCHLAVMDAVRMAFRDRCFDIVLCIQNGISAFGVDRLALLKEALRVARPGGIMLFSSYAERFWKDRLEWFEVQATHGLVGEIDYQATADGVIVCKDGFRATTVRPEEFSRLAAQVGIVPKIEEIAGSSLFCELAVPSRQRRSRRGR